jgi:hypothetical protein
MTIPRLLYFSATIITLDGSGTNAYGEGCEPGQGYTEQSGHWSPDQSYWTVHPDRGQVRPDSCPHDWPRTPGQWLAVRLTARLGTVESFDKGRTFTGAREAIHPGQLTGPRSRQPGAVLGSGTLLGDAIAGSRLRTAGVGLRVLTAAGHAHGFTDDDLTEAAGLLGLTGDDRSPSGRPR